MALELRNIWFRYGSEHVLQDISFKVNSGDCVGVIGPNGSGKTTLLQIILGLLNPERGHVRLFGQEQSEFREWFRIGYVPQRAALNRSFPATVFEVVMTGRIAQRGLIRRLRREDRDQGEQALALVGLERYRDQPIGQLSGGELQRVYIARALASEPSLLILDEPTVGVDTVNQEHFYTLLRRLRTELSLTIMMVSHDLEVMTAEVTDLICLNRRLFYSGRVHQFDMNRLAEIYGYPVVIHHHRDMSDGGREVDRHA